ncbi:hypothetical protein [Lysobacter xanthus]
MARSWSSSATDRRIRTSAALLGAVLALAACGRDAQREGADAVANGDDASTGRPLPAPTAAPGTSVTGMPTTPPPPRPAETPTESVATADPAAPLPAPVDGGAIPGATVPDPAAPTPPPPAVALPPEDAAAATSVVTQYFAAVTAGAPAKAQALWTTTPNDSAVLQLSRGAVFGVDVGAPTADAGGRVSVPVDVRGRADDGSERRMQAVYSVQRSAPEAPWRIVSAAVRDARP